MKAKCLLIFMLAWPFSFYCCSQEYSDQETPNDMPTDLKEQINKIVWIPIMEAYRCLDIVRLMFVQSSNLIKMQGADRLIYNYEDYKNDMEHAFTAAKLNNSQIKIEFSFTNRLFDDKAAHEMGYYNFFIKNSDDSKFRLRASGFFYARLIRIEGIWKVNMFMDSGTKIEKNLFKKGEILMLDNY